MDTIIMNQIGKRLRKKREQLNMTREVFSEKVGISPQFLAEIENGKKGMSAGTLYKICLTFNFSADYILLGRISGEPHSSPATEMLSRLSEPYLSYAEDIIEIVDKIIPHSEKDK